MTITLAILTAIIIMLMFGAGQKILDNLRLNDKQAIIVLILIAIGIAIPPIYIGEYFAFSIGGYLIPLALCIYMLISCGWSRDLLRAVIGTILVAGICYGLDWILPSSTAEDIIVDNTFVYGIVAGIVAYALGRSRRNAFICAVLGVSLSQIIQWVINFALDTPSVLGLGVGGAFGTYVISVLIAVGLAEFLGRSFTNAKPDEYKKEFNYQTHTYDSEKNGKLPKTEILEENNQHKKLLREGDKIITNQAKAGVMSQEDDQTIMNKTKDKNKSSNKEKMSAKNQTDKSMSLKGDRQTEAKNFKPQQNDEKSDRQEEASKKLSQQNDKKGDEQEKRTKNASQQNGSSKTKNKNGKKSKVISTVASCLAVILTALLMFGTISMPLAYASEVNTYYTVYDYSNRDRVVLKKGGEVENGDLYLSADNKLYEICGVDDNTKIAYAKYIKDEELPEYNISSVYENSNQERKNTASAKSSKYVGVYHTHNDESYYTPDGVDSVYGEGGIHDVGARLVSNFNSLGIKTEYSTSLHLPHNSGAYSRSQVTAKALLDKGVDAIFDIHRDSTPRSEYLTTVNGTTMSKVRMVIGSANQNYEENKNFAYSIKAYADKVYPNFIKDIYMGGGNYNQQLSGFAMLFEMGCENIEKEYVLNSCQPLAKTLDVVLYGSEEASQASLSDVDLNRGDGTVTVVAGLSNSGSGASWTSLWVVLAVLAITAAIIGITCIFSKKARYKVARFFSEMFAGMFGKKKIQNN